MVYVNKVFNNNGLREIAIKKDPNTFPIPTPAPIREIVAKPAAIIFADNKIIIILNCIITYKEIDIYLYFCRALDTGLIITSAVALLLTNTVGLEGST